MSINQQQPRTFNPNDHLIQIKNKGGAADYLPVQFRLVWFREACPDGQIETEMIQLDLDRETEEETFAWNNETRRSEKVIKRANGMCIFRATVRDGKGGMATGTKSEKAASFPDYIEKAETGAIGRALAALGYGTQFAPELNEEHRIVDAPVERAATAGNGAGNGAERKPIASVHPTIKAKEETPATASDPDAPATPQQLTSFHKLASSLGKGELEEPQTYAAAREMLAALSAEYRSSKKAS